jgi:hypothetical protein
MYCANCQDGIGISRYCHTCYAQLQAENARLRDFVRIEADALEENGFSVDADRFRDELGKE